MSRSASYTPPETPPRRMRLATGTLVQHHEQLLSTSAQAAYIADQAPDLPQWIVCDIQTGGYGRRGRAWSQTYGDFAATLMMRPKTDKGDLSAYSFIAALATHHAIRDCLASNDIGRVKTKWPNDILIDGKKVAGILLELLGPTSAHILTIGIGINVVSHPEDTPYPATSMSDFHAAPTIIDLATHIDRHLNSWEKTWQSHGFAAIRTAWLEVAHGLHQPVTVRLPDREISGRFEDIGENGEMIICVNGERQMISTGDVFFGR